MNRRRFLAAGAGILAGCHDLDCLSRLAPLASGDVRVNPDSVRFDPSIEPAVRWLEETPRERLLEEALARIRRGLTYREALAALLLAGIRNIQPRPSVGFKFHAVLVVHSAHLIALASPPEERWLPLLWAFDQFKRSQAADVSQGDWTMAAVDARALPASADARRAFVSAMDQWDERGADAAAAAVARQVPPDDAFELFARYAARDVRSIGHKAIYVANAWRTLDTIGWQHGEPVLRSLAFALLAREGSDPLRGDASVDRPARRNRERLGRVAPGWQGGRSEDGATAELLAAFREGTDDEMAEHVVALLRRGVAPQSLWDGVTCGAAELLVRNPGIVSLHAVTTTNAIRYLYGRTRHDETRRMLLLQNASFLPFFRSGGGSGVRLDALEPLAIAGSAEQSVSEICAGIGSDNARAARQVLAYLARHGPPGPLLRAANRLVFLKGNDSHDYKFSAAVFEDYLQASPAWRDRQLAASVYWLNGSGAPDNELVQRARQALAAAGG
jgi:hypothetical protein